MFDPRMKRLLALVMVLLVCVVMFQVQRRHRAAHRKVSGPAALISPELLAQFTAIETRENQLNETTWAAERRAEQYGAVFDSLWDEVNRATNKLDPLASFPIGQLVWGKYGSAKSLPDGLQTWESVEPGRTWLQAEWEQFLAKASREGWRLEHIGFRQVSFDPATNNLPERSRFSFRADVQNTNGLDRASLEGDLLVEWVAQPPGAQAAIKQVDATRVQIRSRHGLVPFQLVLNETIPPP